MEGPAEIDVEGLPPLSKKKGVAKWADTSTRNIELQVAANKFPQPIRIGHAPRWRRSDLLAWLDSQRTTQNEETPTAAIAAATDVSTFSTCRGLANRPASTESTKDDKRSQTISRR